MSKVEYSIGIDPGWKNLGFSIVKKDESGISLVYSTTINPSLITPIQTVSFITKEYESHSSGVKCSSLVIERYVSYSGVLTPESENILMTIGMLHYGLQPLLEKSSPEETRLVRAIDWKTKLVKLLVKNKGFDNPSTSLDKKFSVAAANACLDLKKEFSNDHEADAICLASLPLLEERYRSK